jgi:hypothetical protein
MKRLAIVVPYRDRQAHLNQFVPHLRTYFTRDKLDKDIEYSVVIVEQTPGLPFNRGALNNIGFLLKERESDYTCFHDVDYLPVWADYSYAEEPTPILWYGAETRPIAPGKSQLYAIHDPESLFGGATLIPNSVFRGVNGFANDYWGWGFEDLDLKARFHVTGVPIGRRKGSFVALDHDSSGFTVAGKASLISDVNGRMFHDRLAKGVMAEENGLSNLRYDIVRRVAIEETPGQRPATWEIVTVAIGNQPTAEQIEAIRQA